MKEKQYYKYINFTPYKLKVFNSENFSIETTPLLRHKSSFSYINKNRIDNTVLIRNPTENFLFDKININNLSTSKYLINKSITNSKSVDIDFKRNNKSKNYKNKKNDNYCQNNIIKILGEIKNRTPIKNHPRFNKNITCERYLINKNFTPFLNSFKTNTYKNESKYLLKERKQRLNKIILIQSFWRSYFLRKLVVGGLEKYYSSIAISKYLENIFFQNKKSLFNYLIELLKEYILYKNYSTFKYRNRGNNINIFFKEKDDTNNSFEIPNDKKKDCIYFFIKREQNKLNKIKIKDSRNFIINNKKNNLNIKECNLKNEAKRRNTKNKIISLYDKNNNDKYSKDNFKNNINIKINLFNHNNIKGNKNKNVKNIRFLSEDSIIKNNIKYVHKNKININSKNNKKLFQKIKPKNIYAKKTIGEKSISNLIKKEISSSSIQSNYIKNKMKLKIKSLLYFLKIIKIKFLHFYFVFFINNLKIEKKNNKNSIFDFQKICDILNKITIKYYFLRFKNIFSTKMSNITEKKKGNNTMVKIFPKRNITYYKKKNSKYNYAKLANKTETNYQYQKIKVNKNNQIEKYKKLKLLKKIIEKKLNLIKKKNIIYLTKYFIIWKNKSQLLFTHLNNEKIERKYKSNTVNSKIYRQKSDSKKKHVKVKYKKTFSNLLNNYSNTFYSSTSNKKNYLSKSTKKMKINKLMSNSCSNLFSSFSKEIDSKSKQNLMNIISKKNNDFYNKVIFLIKLIEKKNIIYKYFIEWKKESKKIKTK